MRLKTLFGFAFMALALALAACNKDDVITTDPAPVIKVVGGNAFEVKVGGEVTLSPEVEYADGASFEWIIEGRTVATSRTYKFKAKQVGTFYIRLRVSNSTGSDEADFRVEVVPLQQPVVSLAAGADRRIEVLAGKPCEVLCSVGGADEVEYEWLLDGESVSREGSLCVQIDQIGEYPLKVRVTAEDGSDEASATLCVVENFSRKLQLLPLATNGKPARRYVSLGRELLLRPMAENFLEPTFEWQINGETAGNESILRYAPEAEGVSVVSLVVTDADGLTLQAEVEVECCAAEGSFMRAPTAESAMACNRVFEYSPAAGQFINEDKSGFAGQSSADEAVTYAAARLAKGLYVSLGAWGGYLVAGFDHSVADGEGYDIVIAGNMHEGSSEAGIVWLSQDTNGNGLPDDEWYELRGSEYDAPTTLRDYAVTYYAPAADGMDILWRDNRGATGRIARVDAHKQASYYPAWADKSSFTLYGTRLESRTTLDSVTGNYVNAPFAWGYADNLGSDLYGDSGKSNGFDIANAVAADGSPANLQYVDFVKVQSAINTTAGHLGEISTELCSLTALR